MAAHGADGLLEAESDQAGEEEATKGKHMEGHQVRLRLVPGGALRRGKRSGTVGGGPRQPREGRKREQRVHVHDPVQRRYADARPATVAHLRHALLLSCFLSTYFVPVRLKP